MTLAGLGVCNRPTILTGFAYITLRNRNKITEKISRKVLGFVALQQGTPPEAERTVQHQIEQVANVLFALHVRFQDQRILVSCELWCLSSARPRVAGSSICLRTFPSSEVTNVRPSSSPCALRSLRSASSSSKSRERSPEYNPASPA